MSQRLYTSSSLVELEKEHIKVRGLGFRTAAIPAGVKLTACLRQAIMLENIKEYENYVVSAEQPASRQRQPIRG